MPNSIIKIRKLYCLSMISDRSIGIGRKAITMWLIIGVMVGTGSLAIAVSNNPVHQESPPDIQETSDAKIHLQDVDGKIITNVPIEASRIFSPLPIEFCEDIEKSVTSANAVGSSIVTKQKAVLNFVLDVSEDAHERVSLCNRSEDPQIFLIKAAAPPHVILDMEPADTNPLEIHGLTGHNEWIASIDGDATDQRFFIEVSTTDAGFYPIVVQLLRIG